MDRRSVIHRARLVASVGLLGAVLGGALPLAAPIGIATLGAEEIGLVVGLVAGAVLTAKHLI